MKPFVSVTLRYMGFMGAIAGLWLAAMAPSWAGKGAAGIGSGVTTGGSGPLTIGASDLGGMDWLVSASPNASFDPLTNTLLLTAAAQDSLNQAGIGLLPGLQTDRPALALVLTNPLTIDLDCPAPSVQGIASAATTPCQAAEETAAAIAAGNSTTLTTPAGRLTIPAPSPSPVNPDLVSTTVNYTPEVGNPTTLTLTGTVDHVANAAAFLAAAAAAGIAPDQVSALVDVALAGVDYALVVALVNSLANLLDEEETLADLDAAQLEAAIRTYNQILETSDLDTLQQLSSDPEFVTLGQVLSTLRAAIDAPTS